VDAARNVHSDPSRSVTTSRWAAPLLWHPRPAGAPVPRARSELDAVQVKMPSTCRRFGEHLVGGGGRSVVMTMRAVSPSLLGRQPSMRWRRRRRRWPCRQRRSCRAGRCCRHSMWARAALSTRWSSTMTPGARPHAGTGQGARARVVTRPQGDEVLVVVTRGRRDLADLESALGGDLRGVHVGDRALARLGEQSLQGGQRKDSGAGDASSPWNSISRRSGARRGAPRRSGPVARRAPCTAAPSPDTSLAATFTA